MASHVAPAKQQTLTAHHGGAHHASAHHDMSDCEKSGHAAHTNAVAPKPVHAGKKSIAHQHGSAHDPFECCDTACAPPGALPVAMSPTGPAIAFAVLTPPPPPELTGFAVSGLERPPRSASARPPLPGAPGQCAGVKTP
ncbi:MAG: hypothetical protein FJX29_03605 [Alphaproteobacteria bacterium]|nr:hypothetical protein [Alphaproteobacteria bacterium]